MNKIKSIFMYMTRSMDIILLSGYSMSGKDTVGNILCQEYGFRRYAFADGLKELVAHKYGCDIQHLHTQEGKLQFCSDTGTSWRSILIEESKLYKSANQDIFADMCINSINTTIPIPYRVVITDWRFPNELYKIQSCFTSSRIIPVLINRLDQYDSSPVHDSSEYLIETYCAEYIKYELTNTTPINNLYMEIENMMTSLHIGVNIKTML